MADIHAAALATLAPSPDRREAFDALYRAHFLGQTLPGATPTEEEEVAYEPEEGADEDFEPEEINEAGGEATAAESLALRGFPPLSEAEALRRFRRAAPARLPRRRSRRMASGRAGERPDMRRALRDAVRRDGEIVRLPQLRRRTRQRRILLLIDVSGSMKGETDAAMRFAHTLTHAAERVEVFTVGTRLTRVTRALRHRRRETALAAAAAAVADWDGGTRLGDALRAFLGVPRYAGFARSSYVIILSDGLERGDPAALVDAVMRLSRLAWAILWLTPLATRSDFVPETEALRAVAPYLTRIGDASSPGRITDEILTFARET
nr:VWA domain-containing protein [Acuticoccus kalidii]